MSSDAQQAARAEYQSGRACFERGNYGRAVERLEKASALVERASVFGGEVQIWLVTAYQAAGREREAIALCEKLTRHPQYETRKQSRRLIDILKAPRLAKRPEWLTQIPDLGAMEESDRTYQRGQRPAAPRKIKRELPEPVDLSQVNTRENGFVWLALLLVGLILGSLAWLA